jgi:hypothetical protein
LFVAMAFFEVIWRCSLITAAHGLVSVQVLLRDRLEMFYAG